MNKKEEILKYLKGNKTATGKELSELLGISRQAVNKHLKGLILDGSAVKEGATRGAFYRFPTGKRKAPAARTFKKTYSLSGLEEDKVFQELAVLLNLKGKLSKSAFDIAHYAFTEILNNAVDHSRSEKCSVVLSLDSYRFKFCIRDFGIGIFYSIFRKFNLSDEYAAIGELIKGKTTTMEGKHTGEGIFFTSKSADSVSFKSHRLNLIFDNQKQDVFVEERRSIIGTEVNFSISKRQKRRLDKLFEQYAPEEFDYKFEKTQVQVKLFYKDYVSRSEAKRLLLGLDKFREITMDFKNVKSIGQGFADEIFRVFKNTHPNIIIITKNIRSSLEPIIKHVVDNIIK